MHSIIYNFMTDRGISGSSEALALRSAYILGDGLSTAGTGYATITYDSFFSTMSLENKIKAIAQRAPDGMVTDGFSVEQVLQMFKIYRKVKHHAPKDIIMFKKLEKSIEAIFKFDHEAMLNKMKLTGLPQLEPLVNSKEMNILGADSRNSELDSDYSFPVSKVMTLDFGDEGENDLFFLTHEFMIDIFQEKMPAERRPLYVEPVYTFPNLIVLNADELRTVKSSIADEAKPFRAKVDQWIKLCNENSAEESRKFFYNEVKPLTNPVNQKLEQNTILRHTDNLYAEKSLCEVVMGEVPLLTVWAFFLFHGTIPETTRKILEELTLTEAIQKRRVPFLANRIKSGLIELPLQQAKVVEGEQTIAPSRKTLDID